MCIRDRVYGPGIAINCEKQGAMHYWDDYIYIEIVDPKTGEVLPDGEVGEIVITTLKKEGAPLIRYRTHDLSRICLLYTSSFYTVKRAMEKLNEGLGEGAAPIEGVYCGDIGCYTQMCIRDRSKTQDFF